MKGGLLLNRSKQIPAEDSAAFGGIAERFRRAGDLDRAIALCRDGLAKFPSMLSARVTLGWALLDKGEYAHARVELEQVLRRAPDNLAAIRGLAELHDRTAHMPDGSPAWHQEQQEALEDLAAAMQAAASEPIPVESSPPVFATSDVERSEPAFVAPVLITAAEQAMAAADHASLLAAHMPADGPTIAFEVEEPAPLTSELGLDPSGVFTQLVIDEGDGFETAPAATQSLEFDPPVPAASIEFDAALLVQTQALEFDAPQAAHSDSLELDPAELAPGELANGSARAEVGRSLMFTEDVATDPEAEWSTEALDLDLAPVPETVVTLPTTETVELDALATVFASAAADEAPDCVLEIGLDEPVSAEQTVMDLQSPLFAEEGTDLAGIGAAVAARHVDVDIDVDDLAVGLDLRRLPVVDFAAEADDLEGILDSGGRDEPDVASPIAAFARIEPPAAVSHEIAPVSLAAFAGLAGDAMPPAPTMLATREEPIVRPQTLEERYPVIETGVVLPAARHPALAPLERLLRQVQAHRLELATTSMA